MTYSLLKLALLGTFAACVCLSAARAQTTPTTEFAPEDAIMDTSIAFVTGAQEARQDLRGSFGWATYQEGLVEGVYFRFDPDGYAHFAPSPRLDTDVFEVLCRPGTTSCVARKGPLSVFLNAQNQLQLRLEDFRSGDRIFIAEGLTEIELPAQVMMPLENRLVSLLSVGGEFITRRGEAEASRVSMTGFGPVTTYLKWVSAGQSATVLPRGWPVPASSLAASRNLSFTNVGPSIIRNQTAPLFERPDPDAQAAPVQQPIATEQPNSTLEELAQIFLNTPREQATAPQTPQIFRTPELPEITVPDEPHQAHDQLQTLNAQIAQLQAQISALQAQPRKETLAEMAARTLGPAAVTGRANPGVASQTLPTQTYSVPSAPVQTEEDKRIAHIAYLVNELGLDTKTALAVLHGTYAPPTAAPDPAPAPPATDDFVQDILLELRAELPELEAAAKADQDMPVATMTPPAHHFTSLRDHLRVLSAKPSQSEGN
ncbi:MAG: hypothetical protein HRU30_18365 [Rhodobacteraceae bacterium]|nr:hypothetical protein [Paracoccaceae bacterium]